MSTAGGCRYRKAIPPGAAGGHANTASLIGPPPFLILVVTLWVLSSMNFLRCFFRYFLALQGYYMWDSFAAGVALSGMRHGEAGGVNEFAELEYMNINVVTSNEPNGARDGSNPFFDGRATPKFGLQEGGVHSGHVQTGIRDAFCLVPGGNRGRCEVI